MSAFLLILFSLTNLAALVSLLILLAVSLLVFLPLLAVSLLVFLPLLAVAPLVFLPLLVSFCSHSLVFSSSSTYFRF